MSGTARAEKAELLARNQAFWSRQPVPAPLFGLGVNITFPMVTFGGEMRDGRLSADMIRPEEHLADWDRVVEETAARGEDLLMVATPFAGIPWMEAIAGCTVRFVPGSGSAWAEYPADNPPQIEGLHFDPGNPWLHKLLECTEVLRRHAAGRYPVGGPILRGVSDMVAAILGSQRMVLAFFDEPGLVHDLAGRCAEIWRGVATRLTEAKGSFEGGSCADRRRLWGTGTSLLYQEDAMALASPKVFRQFFLPHTADVLRPFTNSMIHLHSGTLPIVAAGLCALPELRAIEVLLDPGGASFIELLPSLREIQRHKALVICGEMTWEEIETCVRELPAAGLCLQPKVGNSSEADALWPRLIDLCDEVATGAAHKGDDAA